MRKIELGKLEISIPDDTPRIFRLEKELTLLKMEVGNLKREVNKLRQAQLPTKGIDRCTDGAAIQAD